MHFRSFHSKRVESILLLYQNICIQASLLLKYIEWILLPPRSKTKLNLAATFSWRSSLDDSTQLLVFCCIFVLFRYIYIYFLFLFITLPAAIVSRHVSLCFHWRTAVWMCHKSYFSFLFFLSACLFSSHTNSGSFVPLGFQSSSLSKACGWRRGQKKTKRHGGATDWLTSVPDGGGAPAIKTSWLRPLRCGPCGCLALERCFS